MTKIIPWGQSGIFSWLHVCHFTCSSTSHIQCQDFIGLAWWQKRSEPTAGGGGVGWREHGRVMGPRWAALSRTQRSAVSLRRKSPGSPSRGQVERPGSRCWRGDSKWNKRMERFSTRALKTGNLFYRITSEAVDMHHQKKQQRDISTLISFETDYSVMDSRGSK